MRRVAIAFIVLVHTCAPAAALVGGALSLGNASARPVVMITSNRGSFCTGTAIARDLVLTAAHCVLPGADYKLVEFDPQRQPVLRDVVNIARHPQFSLQSLLAHRATADVALLKLSNPLSVTPASLVGARERVAVGERFAVHGYGVAVRGDGRTGGTLRAATLAVTGKPGNLQIRLVDPNVGSEQPGLGACTGDSGAPVFQDAAGRLALVGVVSWSTGPGGSAGCGGLTGMTPIELYRGWMIETARKLGSTLLP
jgi:secreted trypsin-like serine protease